MVIIKDENDNIIYMISSENLVVENKIIAESFIGI